MWRTKIERAESAGERLRLAAEVWNWEPHSSQRRFFSSEAQIRVAACGRRWGKTEALGVDIASLAITEAKAGRPCRQLIVAPSDAQVRLLGDEALSRLRAAFEADTPWTEGLALDERQRPWLQITLYPEGMDPHRLPTDRKAKRKASEGSGPAVARLLFRTAARDGAGLRGLWAHRIVVDEASRVPDLVMTEVLLPMLMDVGGDYVLASSPFGRRSAFYRLWTKGQSAPTPPSSGTPPPSERERGQGQSAVGASHSRIGLKVVADADRREELNESPLVNANPAMSDSHRPLSLSALRVASAEGGGVPDEGGVGATFESFQCPTSDNPHNDAAFLGSMRDEMGDAVYAQEILAEFTDDAGAVFREEDIVGCLEADSRVEAQRGELRSAPQPGRLYSAGVDWGRRQDFTVLTVLDATETPARLVSLQRWTGTGWDAQVAAVAETLARFGPVKVLCDGNSIGDPLLGSLADAVRAAQVRLGRAGHSGFADPHGIAVERFTFTADSKMQLVDRLTLGLSRRGLRYPNHTALLSELRGFEYCLGGSSGRARMAARGAGHDDIVMSLALAWWCAPEGLPEPPSSRILLGSMLGLRRG